MTMYTAAEEIERNAMSSSMDDSVDANTPLNEQSRGCASPDSVLFWPGDKKEATPVKLKLDLEPIEPLPQSEERTFLDVPSASRRVSFADEHNSPLIEVREIEPCALKRLVLLLLSPNDRKFEFLNIEYPLDDNTTVEVVVEQLPKLAANPAFKKLTFSCLARTSKNEKLDNNMVMGDYEFKDNELLLGVLMGYPINEIGAFAVPLLLNGDIIKAVKQAKRSGRGLKTVKSGNEWKRRFKSRKIRRASTKAKIDPFAFESSETEIPSSPASSAGSENEASASDKNGFNSTATSCDVPSESMESTVSVTGLKGVDALRKSFDDCHAELTRWAEAPSPERFALREVNDKRKSKTLNSLESNVRNVVAQLVTLDPEYINIDEKEVERLISANEPSFEVVEDDGPCEDSFEDMPEMDDDQPEEPQYPDMVQNFLNGGKDKAVFWIHAVSIAAVGYFSNILR